VLVASARVAQFVRGRRSHISGNWGIEDRGVVLRQRSELCSEKTLPKHPRNTLQNRCQIVLKAHGYNDIRGNRPLNPCFSAERTDMPRIVWGDREATGSRQSSNLKYHALNRLRRLLSARRRARSQVMGYIRVRRTGCFLGPALGHRNSDHSGIRQRYQCA
jgi:hypothetical protein